MARQGWPPIFENFEAPYHRSRKQGMPKYLEDLLEAAKKAVLTPKEKERQRRSFATTKR